MDFKLPDKLTYKRNEITKIIRLDGKVIDYWEKEFGGLNPVINKLGEKFYTKKDVEIILKIKRMLIGEKRDKEEIKKIIREESAEPDLYKSGNLVKNEQYNRAALNNIRNGLQEILTILDKHVK